MRPMLAAVAIALALSGCASSSSRPVRTQFDDIPMPSGLTLDVDKTTVIESPNVKAARLVYRGRVEVTTLAAAMRSTLESNGWRTLSSTTSADKGTTQLYERGTDSLQVLIYEGFWNTFVELAGTRVQTPGATAASPAAAPAARGDGSATGASQAQVVQPLTPVPPGSR